jgi:hypothetical protein
MKLLKHRSMRFYLAFFLILTMVMGGSAIAAFADSGTATATLTAGNLTVQGTYANALVNQNLDGTDHLPTYSLPFTVTDATGSGVGWNLQISMSPVLTCNSGTCTNAPNTATLDQKLIAVTSPTCAGQGACTDITSSAQLPVNFTIGTTATKFFEADKSTGLGIFKNGSATIQVSIPGNAYAGTYKGTIVLASYTGP